MIKKNMRMTFEKRELTREEKKKGERRDVKEKGFREVQEN